MKKKILILFSIVFFCAICFFGCGVAALKNGPKAEDIVYGNGGFSVVKGDYLYFSNAYYDYNNLKEGENKYDFGTSLKVYGIYRVKLNDDKLVQLDDNGFPVGAELMVPQIGAYAYSGLYICGNYLYYTTPFTGNKSGTYVKGLITFRRVNLDRTNPKLLLTMEEYDTNCKYFVNYIDGITYITILNTNSSVTLLTVQGENVQNRTIATNALDVITTEQTELSGNTLTNNNSKYVYYTKQDGNYYSLYRRSFSSLAEEILIDSSSNKIELVSAKNDRVYFKESNILKSSTFENNEIAKTYSNQEISTDNTTGIKSFYILNDTNGARLDRGIACVSYNGTDYSVSIYNNSTSQYLFSNSNQINILNVNNNSMFYQLVDDNALYCFNISNFSTTKITDEFITSVSDENTGVYDFDLYHAFYFNTVEGSNNTIKYLHMLNLYGYGYQDDGGNNIGHYIGVLDASNMK